MWVMVVVIEIEDFIVVQMRMMMVQMDVKLCIGVWGSKVDLRYLGKSPRYIEIKMFRNISICLDIDNVKFYNISFPLWQKRERRDVHIDHRNLLVHELLP